MSGRDGLSGLRESVARAPGRTGRVGGAGLEGLWRGLGGGASDSSPCTGGGRGVVTGGQRERGPTGHQALHTDTDLRDRCGHTTCACADIRDELQGRPAGVVHADHLLSALGGILALLHQLVLVPSSVDHGQQVCLQVVLQLQGGKTLRR